MNNFNRYLKKMTITRPLRSNTKICEQMMETETENENERIDESASVEEKEVEISKEDYPPKSDQYKALSDMLLEDFGTKSSLIKE